jgi:pyrroloquinoline quinone (PQQ) biosynthesis protein C
MSQPTYGRGLEAALRGRFAQADWLWAEIAQVRRAWSIDRHPLQQRWLSGALGAGQLQAFAGERYHAVLAVADAARRAAAQADGLLGEELTRYADEQEDCLDLWCEFAAATGWGRSAWYFGEDPLPETVACARAWTGQQRSLAEHLVTLYAIELMREQVAAHELEAVRDRYCFAAPATRYFRHHATRAATDAALLQAGLTSLLPLERPHALVRRAELAHRAYRALLDGVHALSAESVS